MERRDPDTEEHERERGERGGTIEEGPQQEMYDTKIHPTSQKEEGKDRREEAKRKDRAQKRKLLLDTAGNCVFQA